MRCDERVDARGFWTRGCELWDRGAEYARGCDERLCELPRCCAASGAASRANPAIQLNNLDGMTASFGGWLKHTGTQ